jgi:hypothetical protein
MYTCSQVTLLNQFKINYRVNLIHLKRKCLVLIILLWWLISFDNDNRFKCDRHSEWHENLSFQLLFSPYKGDRMTIGHQELYQQCPVCQNELITLHLPVHPLLQLRQTQNSDKADGTSKRCRRRGTNLTWQKSLNFKLIKVEYLS